MKSFEKYVIFCVGSSKNVCDSFGPFVGEFLKKLNIPCYVYGNLKDNINAKNVKDYHNFVKIKHINSKIIVVDCKLCQTLKVKLSSSKGELMVAGLTQKLKLGDYNFTLDISKNDIFNLSLYDVIKLAYRCAKNINDFVINQSF